MLAAHYSSEDCPGGDQSLRDAKEFVSTDLHNPVFEGYGRRRLFLSRGYLKAKCELMRCQTESPSVYSQKTNRMALISEEEGRGTLLRPN